MMETVYTNVVILDQPFLHLLWQGLEGASCIREVCVASSVRRWKLGSSKQRVRSPSWIVGAVDMEERVGLAEVDPRAVVRKYAAVVIDIASIEEFVVVVTQLSSANHEASNVVQLAEPT